LLKKLFKKKIKEKSETKKKEELIEKVDQMDIYAMASYLEEDNPSELGIEIVLQKLVKRNEATKRRFIESTDSKFKLNKCFDMVIDISEHNSSSKKTLILLEKFIYTYSDLIRSHDERNDKEYEEKINHAIFFATKRLIPQDDAKTSCDIKETK